MVPSAIDPGGSGPETGEVLFFDGGVRTTRAKSSSTLAGFIEFIMTDKIVGTAGEDARPTDAGTAAQPSWALLVALESLPQVGGSRYDVLLLAGCFPPLDQPKPEAEFMTHAQMVDKAVRWLRHYRCGVVLSEQACASGETPDAIGWKRASHSVLVECTVTRADFLVDRAKPFRLEPEQGVGSERFYLTPAGLVKPEELPEGWGLLEIRGRGVEMVHASAKNLRSAAGFRCEMNLLLASLRRVELRIEPQSITDFLKWKNRMAEYNRGTLPEGLAAAEDEGNVFLEPDLMQ